MNSDKHEPFPPSIETLLAHERIVEAQPEEVRRRALARARTAVSAASPAPKARFRLGGWGWRLAVALVVLTAAVSAAAIRSRHKPGLTVLDPEPAGRDKASVGQPPALPAPQAEGRDYADPAPKNEAVAHRAPAGSSRPVYERYALELKVLQPARAAVARGDFSSALSAIAEHERRFPNGELAEEREALRVQALSGLGRTEEASRAAAAFRERFPGSVLLSRMPAVRPVP